MSTSLMCLCRFRISHHEFVMQSVQVLKKYETEPHEHHGHKSKTHVLNCLIRWSRCFQRLLFVKEHLLYFPYQTIKCEFLYLGKKMWGGKRRICLVPEWFCHPTISFSWFCEDNELLVLTFVLHLKSYPVEKEQH